MREGLGRLELWDVIEQRRESFEAGETSALPLNVWLVGQTISATQRRGRYVPESFVHPAKMLPAIARNLVETYTKPGDFVVDPMSGIGTTGVEAYWLGRNYVGIEIEPEYVELQRKNLALSRAQRRSNATAKVIRGDARKLVAAEKVALVAFSPPYQDAIHPQYDELGRIRRKIERGEASPELLKRYARWDERREQANAGMRPVGYSANGANVGHLEGSDYWQAMRAVYERAYETLRPGGYLAVVTKDQRDRKSGELTNIYGETVAVCRSLGFLLHQHIVALLCSIDQDSGEVTPRTSHWQRMAVRKAPEKGKVVLLGQFEDVVVFRRPTVKEKPHQARRAPRAV